MTSAGWLPTGLRWNSNQFPIEYCVTANSNNTNVNSANQRAAVLEGINAWVATGSGGNLSCTTYQAGPDASSCGTSVNPNQRYDIFWKSNWGNGSGTIGVTWSWGSGSNCGSVQDDTGTNHSLDCKFDSDIEFNDRDFFWTTSGQGGTDIASIAAHEYGHFIGLDHCNENGTCGFGQAIMFASYGGGTVRVPYPDDVQGACALYPGNPGGLGWPCSANNQCNSNVCVNAGNNGYCSQTCGNCPGGYTCDTNPNNPGQNVCVRDDGLNQDECEICQLGLPGACANNGICVRGIPETNSGRCVEPCQGGNTCADANFQCLQVQFQGGGTGDYCFPRSNDCNDPGNFTELQIGQACTGNPPCAAGLSCVGGASTGICSPDCTNNPGVCPPDWTCADFQGGNSFCLPSVREGGDCSGLVACEVGPCLQSGNRATCFQDCAGNPGACNNAQMCNTYGLQGGGQVSICEPPGVPPLPPDAGVITPDLGPGPGPDAGQPGMDAGVVPGQDLGTVGPGMDMGMVNPQPDMGTNNPNVCLCDETFACDQQNGSSCLCDPECICACDETFACDPGCGQCDPECQGGGGTCTCTSFDPENTGLATALLFLALLGLGLTRGSRRSI